MKAAEENEKGGLVFFFNNLADTHTPQRLSASLIGECRLKEWG